MATACADAGTCLSPSCTGGLRCLAEEHVAYRYTCTRASTAEPWQCVQQAPIGFFALNTECQIACAEGQSACQENDTDVGTACRACYASCLPYSDTTCDGEAPGTCPSPCACR
jgi:hypothetical protein